MTRPAGGVGDAGGSGGVSLVMTQAERPTFPGGRRAALARLAQVRPSRYGGSRNFLDGDVTRLSPYLHHGVLDLAEVRDAVLTRASASTASKLVFELAWRDYYRRVLAAVGDDVRRDLEPWKTGFGPADYAAELPRDVREGATGLACIDAFVRDLTEDGYVHNHARMYFASYVVHHRRVDWRAGAAFYLAHLLDGDVASNDLSWQWVASTFGASPYVFDRRNLARYTRDAFCPACPKRESGCPFDASYAELERRLFRRGGPAAAPAAPGPDETPPPARRITAEPDAGFAPPATPEPSLVWHHVEALSPSTAARRLAPEGSAAVVVIDDDGIPARERWSAGRHAFVRDCAAECAAPVVRADEVRAVTEAARASGASRVYVDASPDPLIATRIAALAREFEVVVVPPRPFVRLDRATDLRRFSRYWKRAQASAFAVDDGYAATILG